MAKKQVGVSLRKPPPVDVDAFVADAGNVSNAANVTGAMSAITAPVLGLAKKPAEDVVVSTDSGRALREMTVYLPVDLARKMSMHCVEKDRDVSNLVAEAISTHLTPKAAPQPPARVPATTKQQLLDWGRSLRARFAF